MKTINFSSIFRYFEDTINNITRELFDQNIISENIKFKMFQNAAEYFEAFTNPKERDNDRTVLASIVNDGGLQDSSVMIDTYVQMISMEFFAREDQREDLMEILTKLVTDHKTKLISLEDSTVNVTIGDLPEYSSKFEAEGYEKFTAYLEADLVVFTSANLSNLYQLNIDGSDLLCNTITFARTTDLTADLQKRNATKFYPNTTGFQIVANGLYVDNDALNTLFSDCISNSRFNVPYTVTIKKWNADKTEFTELRTGEFFIKSSTFKFIYGSIASYDITLYEGLVI